MKLAFSEFLLPRPPFPFVLVQGIEFDVHIFYLVTQDISLGYSFLVVFLVLKISRNSCMSSILNNLLLS